MYLQKVISRKTSLKYLFFVAILKVNDENSRIRIQIRIWIHFSQRHGSADPEPHQNVLDPEHRWKCLNLQQYLMKTSDPSACSDWLTEQQTGQLLRLLMSLQI
jgi:hypothetical protein